MNDSTGTRTEGRERRRALIAMAICAMSAAAGVVAIELQRRVPTSGTRAAVASYVGTVGGVWIGTGDWLGRRLGLLRMRPGDIYRHIRENRFALQGIAKTIANGGRLLLLASLLYWLAPLK